MKSSIEFQGCHYLLIGTLNDGGAISTPEQYANFEPSYAHLNADSRVMRYGRQIGTRDEIQILMDDDTQPTAEGKKRFLEWLCAGSFS